MEKEKYAYFIAPPSEHWVDGDIFYLIVANSEEEAWEIAIKDFKDKKYLTGNCIIIGKYKASLTDNVGIVYPANR